MMKRLRQKYEIEQWQLLDLERMRKILNNNGYDADLQVIAAAYEQFSEDSYCAGWYSIAGLGDEWVFESLMTVLEPEQKDETSTLT